MKTEWRHDGFNALTESSHSPAPAKAQVQVGCTLTNGNTLELLDDESLQIRVRNTEQVINLGAARQAMLAMGDAMCRLEIHF